MSRARVFVCDDEMLIRLWVEEHLEEEGFDVEAFEDGASVIAAVQHDAPDLLLLGQANPPGAGEIDNVDANPDIVPARIEGNAGRRAGSAGWCARE